MIIRQEKNSLEFYTQIDHAAAAAALANHLQPSHNSRELVAETIRLHDVAWKEVDEKPTVLEDGRPRDFLNMAAEVAVLTWTRSIKEVLENLGELSALVVSQHFSRLAQGALGSGSRSSNDEALFETFLNQQGNLRQRLGPQSAEAVEEMASYLHLFDTITVFMLTSSDSHSDMRMKPIPFSLNGCGAMPLQLQWCSRRGIQVDPWPFDSASIALDVPCRILPARRYADDEDLQQAFQNAPLECREYTIANINCHETAIR